MSFSTILRRSLPTRTPGPWPVTREGRRSPTLSIHLLRFASPGLRAKHDSEDRPVPECCRLRSLSRPCGSLACFLRSSGTHSLSRLGTSACLLLERQSARRLNRLKTEHFDVVLRPLNVQLRLLIGRARPGD